MRRLMNVPATRTARGGWALIEFLREAGYLAALLAVAVGVLNQLTPRSQPDEAAVKVAGASVYGLGVIGDGEQLWINRSMQGVSVIDVESMAEIDSIRYRQMLLADADASTRSPVVLAVTSKQEQIQFRREGEFLANYDWSREDGLLSDLRVQADGNAVVAVSAGGIVATWTWKGAGFDRHRDRVEGAVSLLELSLDGRWAAMIVDNESLLLFDRRAGREVTRWRVHNQHCATMAFSPDASLIATGGKDGHVRVWQRATGKLAWEAKADVLSPCAVKFAIDGRRLASGGFDKAVRVWNAADGHLLTTLSAHSGPIRALAFHPDGDRLYSGSLDGELFEWSLATQSVQRRFQ